MFKFKNNKNERTTVLGFVDKSVEGKGSKKEKALKSQIK
jgi:hypothetical protein